VDEHEIRQELHATVQARQELEPVHEQQLVEGFVERIGKQIDARVDERLAQKGATRHRSGSVLHPANLALCIPIIAIAGGIGGVAGLIVAFAALTVVFLYAETQRR
jgi:Flp pilus assembly protein TadB